MSQEQNEKMGLVPAIPLIATNPFLLFITTYWKQLIIVALLGFMVYQHITINRLELEKQLQKVGVVTQSRYFDHKTNPTEHEYQFLLGTKPAQLTLQDTLQFMVTYRKNDLIKNTKNINVRVYSAPYFCHVSPVS